LGVLFGAGAIIGAFAGFDAGVIAGGISSILVELGVKENRIQYEEHIQEGGFLMIIEGSEQEIEMAQTKLEGLHLGMAAH